VAARSSQSIAVGSTLTPATREAATLLRRSPAIPGSSARTRHARTSITSRTQRPLRPPGRRRGDPQVVAELADERLYEAKRAGRDRVIA
jgi:hypothetical protein